MAALLIVKKMYFLKSDFNGELMSLDHLRHLIASRTAKIGLVTPDYTCLLLARAFQAIGFRVITFEIDLEGAMFPRSRGGQHSPEQSQSSWLNTADFEVVTDLQRLSDLDVILIAIPYRLTASRMVDLMAITQVATKVSLGIRSGQLVVLTGCSPPGTTRAIVLPHLGIRLKPGADFSLANSPNFENGLNPPTHRVVGGFDADSLELASLLFEQIHTPVKRVSSLEAAEVCSAVGGVTRVVNAAIANELRMICDRMDVDVREILDACKPPEFLRLMPSIEDCDPAAIVFAWGVRRYGISARLVELANELNSGILAFILEKVTNSLNDAGKSLRNSKILVLGIEKTLDRAIELMGTLMKKGAVVTYNDSYLAELPKLPDRADLSMSSTPLSSEFLQLQDCVLITAKQPTCDYSFIVANSQLVVDTQDATREVTNNREKIVRI